MDLLWYLASSLLSFPFLWNKNRRTGLNSFLSLLNSGLSCDWLFICVVYYYCAITSVTKCHGHRSLKQQKLIFLVLGGQNSKVGFIVVETMRNRMTVFPHSLEAWRGGLRGKPAPGGCRHSWLVAASRQALLPGHMPYLLVCGSHCPPYIRHFSR